MSNVWVCANNNGHRYNDQETVQHKYFCPQCPFGEGILILNPGSTVTGNVSPGGQPPVINVSRQQEDLGLCIMLLDCSGSMNQAAFQNHPMTKKDLISKSVSAGIFSLSGNPMKEFAYVLILGFDHEVEVLMPYTSIEEIVNQYKTATGLEQMLRERMMKKEGATDINEALRIAFNFTQQFINSEIAALGMYKPRVQAVLDDNMVNHQVPNVRVLLFTDGEHYLGPDNRTLLPSPFKNLSFKGETFDLLMSAYYGYSGDTGYHQLKSLVSKCPRHPAVEQFFLFDDPGKVANLKGLFRMASGASGFCPTCLAEANSVIRDN